ncbi:MAG: hypothetical protein IJB73_04480 [Firmicutes bacterium]|nr:hypothetical protein [Bacillota bacterium]
MTTIAADIAKLVDMLPEEDQKFAYEFVKKLVLAWDPDFTKSTLPESNHMKIAEESGFIPENEIDWNNLDKYNE